MTDDLLSDEEKALFRASMRSVSPLKRNAKIHLSATLPPKPAGGQNRETFAPLPQAQVFLSSFIQEPVQANTVLSWQRHSIPSQRFQALKKGRIPWQAQLDLHGLRPEEAQKKLIDFILAHSNNEASCLLVIHGKGSPGGAPPVLKNLIHRWLPQFEEVLAFHSAVPKHGGTGSVYVLLKRLRKEHSHSI